MFFLSVHSFYSSALGSPARRYSVWNGSDKALRFVICGGSLHNTRTVKAKLYKCSQKVRAFGSVYLDLSRLICFVSCHWWAGYSTWERDFFFFTCSVTKGKRRNIQDFCISSNCTLHLQQFISFGIWEQIRKETSGSSSVNSLQFRQIHFLFLASELIKVWFGSV